MSSDTKNLHHVSGIFKSDRDVDGLLSALESKGFAQNDVSMLMSDSTRNLYPALVERTKSAEGASIGGISGGLIGALIGGLTLVGNILLPGAGLLASGPIVGALTGATAGVALGGLVGGLVGHGIPEHEARFYEESLKEHGNVLVIAHVPKDEEGAVRKLFEGFHANSVKAYA